MRVDREKAGKGGGKTLSGSETAPLKPKNGLNGPPGLYKKRKGGPATR